MSTEGLAPKPGPVAIWVSASRLRTLPAAAAPVLVGWAIAYHLGGWSAGPAVAALLGALLLQIAANFANDYFDFVKGVDGPERVGPTRATQAGHVTPSAMRLATALTLALAAVVGLYLIWLGGWPVLAIGIASILTALAYTGGPFPLAYLGLGDLAVFIFFGPVAVVGTAYVQTHLATPAALLLAVGPGLLSAAILGVNNLRDRLPDSRCGKHTLAVRFGEQGARWLYRVELGLAFVLPIGLVATQQVGPGALLCLLALPLALKPVALMNRGQGAALDPALGMTAKLLLAYGLLLALGVAVRG